MTTTFDANAKTNPATASTTTAAITATTATTATTAAATTAASRALLACLAISFPLWGAVSLIQAASRHGYNITRVPLSILTNGPLGWIQTVNFLLCGALAAVGAVGLRRALAGRPGGRWAPRLAAVGGAGMFAAGLFHMDPGNGFPAGTPSGTPTTMSWHSELHMLFGSISFIAVIAACFVFGRYFSRSGDAVRAAVSRTAAVIFIVGDVWSMAGGAWGSLTLAIGALTGMVWVSIVAAHLRRNARS